MPRSARACPFRGAEVALSANAAPGGSLPAGLALTSLRATPRAGPGMRVRRPHATAREASPRGYARSTVPAAPARFCPRSRPTRCAPSPLARGAGDRADSRARSACVARARAELLQRGCRARWRAIRFPMRPYPVAPVRPGPRGAPGPAALAACCWEGKRKGCARDAPTRRPCRWWRGAIRSDSRAHPLPRCPAAARRGGWSGYPILGPARSGPRRATRTSRLGFFVLSVAPAAVGGLAYYN